MSSPLIVGNIEQRPMAQLKTYADKRPAPFQFADPTDCRQHSRVWVCQPDLGGDRPHHRRLSGAPAGCLPARHDQGPRHRSSAPTRSRPTPRAAIGKGRGSGRS